MKVLSLNCRNWNRDTDKLNPHYWKSRMAAMKRMIEDKDPDVICFQELLYPASWYVPSTYRRVGLSISHHIYVKKGMKVRKHRFGIHYERADVEGVRVFCVHGKWTAAVTDTLCKYLIDNLPVAGTAIAAGDFNVPASSLNSRGLYTARQRLEMKEEDTFENFSRPDESYGELDHAICWGTCIKSYEIVRDGYGVERISDHWPIVITI